MAYQRGVANEHDQDARHLRAAGLSSGAQLVVPAMRPSTCSWGRAVSRILSRMARPTATAIPCSTPISTTASQRHRGQPELEEVEAEDGDEVVHVEQPQRDVDQDGGQRRQGNVLQDPGDGDEDAR